MDANTTSSSSAEPSIEFRAGRQAPPYTDVYDWVGLSGINPEAFCLYAKLKMHVNIARGDQECWPSKRSLALMMGYRKEHSLDRHLAQLVKIGAVEIERRGMPARNVYTIHDVPPPGYAGPLTLAEWYRANQAQLDARARMAKERRGRGLDREVTAGPVTPENGVQEHPENGVHAHPENGVEQDLREQRRTEQQKSSSATPAPAPDQQLQPAASRRGDEVARPDVDQLCDHLAARIVENGSKRPTITPKWRSAARLMLDKDGRTVEQVIKAIDWCQDDEFWRTNILSMPKLREKYDQLRLAARRQNGTNGNGHRPAKNGHQTFRNPDPSAYHGSL